MVYCVLYNLIFHFKILINPGASGGFGPWAPTGASPRTPIGGVGGPHNPWPVGLPDFLSLRLACLLSVSNKHVIIVITDLFLYDNDHHMINIIRDYGVNIFMI